MGWNLNRIGQITFHRTYLLFPCYVCLQDLDTLTPVTADEPPPAVHDAPAVQGTADYHPAAVHGAADDPPAVQDDAGDPSPYQMQSSSGDHRPAVYGGADEPPAAVHDAPAVQGTANYHPAAVHSAADDRPEVQDDFSDPSAVHNAAGDHRPAVYGAANEPPPAVNDAPAVQDAAGDPSAVHDAAGDHPAAVYGAADEPPAVHDAPAVQGTAGHPSVVHDAAGDHPAAIYGAADEPPAVHDAPAVQGTANYHPAAVHSAADDRPEVQDDSSDPSAVHDAAGDHRLAVYGAADEPPPAVHDAPAVQDAASDPSAVQDAAGDPPSSVLIDDPVVHNVAHDNFDFAEDSCDSVEIPIVPNFSRFLHIGVNAVGDARDLCEVVIGDPAVHDTADDPPLAVVTGDPAADDAEAVHDVADDAGDSAAIHVAVYNKVAHGQGKKNRKLPCYFCSKFVYQMPRHLQRQHSDERELAAALAAGSDKRLGLKQLCNLGIFKHNAGVLERNDGVLIVSRAPRTVRSVDDFLPCQFCFLFFVRKELYRHCTSCVMRLDTSEESGHIAAGRALLFGSMHANSHSKLKKFVVPRMRLDRLTRVATSDCLITKLGDVLLEKLGQRRALDISARMRELARILIRMTADGSTSLCSFLTGQKFDTVVEAVKAEAGSYVDENGRQLYTAPAFILKAGNSLLKCARLKQGLAVRNGDEVSLNESKAYIKLHLSEYTDRVASAAHAAARIHGNLLSELPDEEDLRKLQEYQRHRMKEVIPLVRDHPDPYLWRELAELALSRLLVFNARRGNEGAQLSVVEYHKATADAAPAIASTLTDVERQLLSR